MIPIKTTIEDMEKLLGYMSRQVGWVEQPKVQKTLGATATDDRKVGAMVELGLLLRDGGNLKLTDRGQKFARGEQVQALRDAIRGTELYRSTIEWIHYGAREEPTATEIAQYWENSHKDTVGDLKGSTLKDGAVCFSRVAEGADLGTFTIGRGGKETRLASDLPRVEAFLLPEAEPATSTPLEATSEEKVDQGTSAKSAGPAPSSTPAAPVVTLSTSPSVHVNVEIHIAADATAETVKEIFKNMARYVLDKPIADDGDS